jgi:hypothetical protein
MNRMLKNFYAARFALAEQQETLQKRFLSSVEVAAASFGWKMLVFKKICKGQRVCSGMLQD